MAKAKARGRKAGRPAISPAWQGICAEIGGQIAEKLLGCEQPIRRAVVDLDQSQATFGASAKFVCDAEGNISCIIQCREPSLKLNPVEIKLAVDHSGQLTLFQGEAVDEEEEGDDETGEE